MFSREAVADLTSPELQGQLSPREALDALLAGSCLTYSFIREALVALKSGPCNPQEMKDEMLPQPAEAPVPPLGPMEEILVRERPLTGTRLQHAGVGMPVPVDVITRPEIELSGHQSLGEILRYLPAVSGNSTSTLVTNGGDGTASVTLRGLPASNTLVLLNGRRMNPEALYGSSVDLNTLPLALIERIEVLKDGASAVYGSDAVAGVVNIMTRRDLDGWHVDAYAGASGEGDLNTHNLSLTYAFNGENTRLLAGASYYEQDPMFSRDRALSSSSDDRARGGIDKRSSATIPARITLETGPVIFDGQSYRPAGDDDRYEYRDHTTLAVPSQRYSLFVDGEHEQQGNTWFFEGLVTNTKSTNTLAPTPLLTGFEKLELPVSEANPYNPFGIEIFDVRRRITEASTRQQENETDTARGVIGVRGERNGVSWQVTMHHSRTQANEALKGAINGYAVQQALSADCASPCVPLDLFGVPGSITEPMLRYVLVQPHTKGKSRMNGGDFYLDFSGPELPAGTIDIALGGEYREESLRTRPDPLQTQSGVIGSGSLAATNGRRTAWEAFAELRLPIFRDRPGIHRLDAYLAGRISRYSDFGRESNPRLLLHYQPSPAWSFRASYSHGFRAPNLIEMFGGTSQSFEQLNDPCSLADNLIRLPGCSTQSDPSLTQFLTEKGGNAELQAERSRTLSLGVQWRKHFSDGDLLFSLDHYRISQQNVVDTNPQLIINDNALGTGFPGLVQRDANGNITRVLSRYLNIGEREVEGFDMSLRRAFDTERLGRFEFAVNTTHISRFVDRLAPGLPAVDQAGTFLDAASGGNGALPDWKASLGLDWQRRFWRARYNVYLVSELEEVVPIIGLEREMELWATHSVQVSYLGPATKWFRISLGINNLLDEAPPFSAAAFNDSYDSRTYDITGRYGYLRLERSI